MEEIIIEMIKKEIERYNEILEMPDTDDLTLQEYKKKYAIIKEYLEGLLIDINKIIKNPAIRGKYIASDNVDLTRRMRGKRDCTIYLRGHWEITPENLMLAEISNINLMEL